MYIVQFDYHDKVVINLIQEHAVGNIIFRVDSRYQELKFLATGSQGTVVCSAYDTVSRQMVAIKKIPNPFTDIEDAKRAYRELKLLKIVNHKYIINYIDAFVSSPELYHFESLRESTSDEENDEWSQHQSETKTKPPEDLYLVMELAEMTLDHVIHIKLDHERISFVVYQIFSAFKYLDNLSIIHRDFKPSNIGIRNDCTIKLFDFGLARKENKMMMTPHSQTLYYCSPEMLLGSNSYSNAIDIWSVGCIMAEMVTSKILFQGTNTIDQWERIVSLLGTPEDEFIDRFPVTIQNYIRKRSCKGLDFEEIFPDSTFLSEDSSAAEHHELSSQARNLLSKILVINPKHRITIDEALDHPYIKIWSHNTENDLDASRVKMNEFMDKNFGSIDDWKELIFKELIRNF